MSWFDAAGLANIAKSALKEAQRTIDKALDIKDDGTNESNLALDITNDDLFGTWVVSQPSKNDSKGEIRDTTQNSIWGSFTGSFFDHSKEYHKSVSLEGLDDSADISSQHFSQSKLVVDGMTEFENKIGIRSGEILEKDEILSPVINEISNLTLVVDGKDNQRSSDKEPSAWSTESKELSNDECDKDSSENLGIIERKNTDDSATGKNESDEAINQTVSENAEIIPFVNITEKSILPDAITVPPSRQSSQLLPSQVIESTLVSTQPQCSPQEIPELLRITNIIDIPAEDCSFKSGSDNTLELSTEEGSQSDVTIHASENNDESCSENENSSSSNKNSSSACVQSDSNSITYDDGISSENLSIVHLEMPPRDYSPFSSDKSDLVKIGSEHTSGDELETTTSSDIEIISSPNGDSSSTQSHRSPLNQCERPLKENNSSDAKTVEKALKNIKIHNRELSETSSISDDSQSQDVEKLLKKITEITEILESRELKIVEINRRNLELQELNMELKTHLNTALSKQSESQDLTQVTEEYAQRMSVLEKKFHQAIREKDTLRKELEQAKQESSMRLSRGDLDTIVTEKDELIKQLREEGEKLSKQQLQHSNIIKKLRAKEKENEVAIKQLKERVENFTSETDRLKRTVNAKEEVERTQIEAVNQLTSKNKKLENALAKVQSELDDQIQKYETLKKSLEAAKKELNDKNKITHQLSAKEQMLEVLENEKKIAESQSQDVINQLQYLRMKLHESESEYLEKEQQFRMENNELMKRLENAESRNEELSQSVLEVSKPLVRQLESLQTSYNVKTQQLEKIEMELTSKVNELQFRLTSASNSEREVKEECSRLTSKLSIMESEYESIKHEKDLLEMQLNKMKTEKMILEQELNGKIDELKSIIKNKDSRIEALNKEISMLKTSIKKPLDDEEQKESANLLGTKQDTDDNVDETNSNPRSSSPTLSVGKVSVADSLVSSVWSQLESFDMGHVPRYTNMLEIQMLQTNLQQREGELQQLQWELSRREQERNLMNAELTALTSKVEDLTKENEENVMIKHKFEELQEQYDLLCQMYGEKVDEVEELKLDLLEAKEAYKSQLDELLKINSS